MKPQSPTLRVATVVSTRRVVIVVERGKKKRRRRRRRRRKKKKKENKNVVAPITTDDPTMIASRSIERLGEMLRQGRIVASREDVLATPRRCLITIRAIYTEEWEMLFWEISSRLASNENAHQTKGNSSRPVPSIHDLSRSRYLARRRERETHRARVYAHLYDNGRRPTVATTVIHDHVDLTNASTSAREYVFIGLYTTTRLYACVSHPGIVPSSTLSVPLPFLFLPFCAISGPIFRSNKTG